MEIFGRQAFIDILFLILCLATVYSAVAKGVFSEFFKTAGVICGVLLAFQFYPSFADVIGSKILIIKEKFLAFVAFSLIFFGTRLLFAVPRLIMNPLFKREKISVAERLFLSFTGLGRAVLFSSVIIFLLHLSPVSPRNFNESLSYGIFKNIAPKFYLLSFKLYNNFNPKALLNEEVKNYEAGRPLQRSNKKGY